MLIFIYLVFNVFIMKSIWCEKDLFTYPTIGVIFHSIVVYLSYFYRFEGHLRSHLSSIQHRWKISSLWAFRNVHRVYTVFPIFTVFSKATLDLYGLGFDLVALWERWLFSSNRFVDFANAFFSSLFKVYF